MINKIRELRELTGAGVVVCKKALAQTSTMEEAVVWLQKQGEIESGQRIARTANEGFVGHYIHIGGQIGVLVDILSETDFTARSKDFQAFTHDLAIHIAAANPRWVNRDEVPAEVLAQEIEIIKTKIVGKPEAVVEKIVKGKVDKFYKEACLLEQTYVRDNTLSIQDLLNALSIKVKERIVVKRFTRYEIGA